MSNISQKPHAIILANNGDQLISDYLSALVNRSTTYSANNLAKQSEQLAEEYIASTPVISNPLFVTPQDIPENMQSTIAKASLDAHMKKIQAQQIAAKSAQQIQQMELNDKHNYVGKKVEVTILDMDKKPLESYWQNAKTGKITNNTVTKKKVKGIIEDIVFNKNLLVLKPTKLSQLFNPERKFFAIYVINPDTLNPMISLIILK